MNDKDGDERYMREALAQAEQAQAAEDVPVGAIILVEGVLVGAGSQPA